VTIKTAHQGGAGIAGIGLSVEQLSHAYGARQALDGVTFSVARGTFCALLGPNGAGKSTLFALLTRLYASRAGVIRVAGHDMAATPRAALARIGVVFQQPTLDLDLSVWRNLLYFAALHGIAGKDAARRSEAALQRLGMAQRAKERVRELNGGHRRRLEIARALIHAPDVLLLDEPTVGLDAAARASITDHVHDLAASGLSVLWATHLTDEVRAKDQLVVLHQGRILADGVMDEVTAGRPLRDVFLTMTANPPTVAP
jgi:ABC-2 type transport system ATP-binding protein